MSLGAPMSPPLDDAVKMVRFLSFGQNLQLTTPVAYQGRYTLHRGCCKWLFASERIPYAEELVG
jgi:hypothetical protein